MNKLRIRDIIENTDHPDWGTWRVTKTPTHREDWYHIQGQSGARVLDISELCFWRMVHEAEL